MSRDILEGEEMSKDTPFFGGGSNRLGAVGVAEAGKKANTMAGVRGTGRS